MKTADLEKARVVAKEARSKIRAAKEELRQAGDITARKPFLLRTKFGDPKYALLDQLWSSADAYLDLAASAADVVDVAERRTLAPVEERRGSAAEGARLSRRRQGTAGGSLSGLNVENGLARADQTPEQDEPECEPPFAG